MNLQNSNCDETRKLKFLIDKKKSESDETQKLKL